MARRVFSGAAVFDGWRLHAGAVVVVEAGRVSAVLPEGEAPAGERVRLDGGVLAPGFIDLQANGGGGVLLNDAPMLEGIAAICAAHGRLGATGLLPTLVTDTPEVTRAVIAAGVAAAAAGVPGFLGLHLEGPHLDPRLIRPMEAQDLALLVEAAGRLPALMVTVAPEAASPAQIAALARAGALVSLGHSGTGMAGARAAFAAGARCVTHLFNAMSGLGHREPGLVGAALDAEGVACGLIADGIHVVPEVIRVALAAKRGVDGVFLVSDAMPVAGTELDGFSLGGRRILRRDGRLTLEDGTLAGADIDMAGSVRVLVRQVGVPLDAALGMASRVPAALIGRGDLGRLARGRAADMVHLDEGLGLAGVWRAGEPVDRN